MTNDSHASRPVPAFDLARQSWAAAALDLARAEGRGDDEVSSEDARVACVVFDGLAAAGLLPEQFSRDALLELGPFMVDEERSPHWLTNEDYERVPGFAPAPFDSEHVECPYLTCAYSFDTVAEVDAHIEDAHRSSPLPHPEGEQ